MNRNKIRIPRLIAGAFAFVLLSAAPMGAKAESFGTTNFINTGVSHTTYPTNGPGLATGTGLNLENYNSVGFYFTCDAGSITQASVIDFTLVRSPKQNTATVTNWETTAQSQYKLRVPIGPITNSTFTWLTNLPNDFAGPGLKVGINGMTNNFTAGCSATNAEAGLVKKIIPIRYP